MKKILLLAVLCCAVFPAWAQTTKLATAPAVTINDLKETQYPQDTAAVAAYQYHYGHTYFDLVDGYWVMITEVFNRIKIYKKEGYRYADHNIVFYSGSRRGKGTISDAVTYNLVNGSIQKTTVPPGNIREDEPEEDLTRKLLKMPDVREGSIIEYKYKIRTPYFTNFEDFYFQFDIPLNEARYDVAVPGYFIYNVYTVGYIDIQKDEIMIKDNNNLECRELVYKYTAKNVSALADEPYVNNLDNYTGMIKYELSTVSLPRSGTQNYATDWKTVARNIYSLDGFGRELKLNSYFEKDIDPIIAANTAPEEKMQAIFNYVKERMTWNEENGYRCAQGVKKAYETRSGNVAEINLMVTAMLRYAGLDANPVLTSTRAHGVAVFPTRTAFNYVISAVKINDKQYLLDATSKYTAPNILPVRTINWMGRLIKKNGDNEEVELTTPGISKDLKTIQCEMKADGSLTGLMRSVYTGYDAYLFRESYAEKSEDNFIERLEKKYKGITINEFKADNIKDLTKPVSESYSFSHQGAADVANSKMYFNPLLFLAQTINPFKQDKRAFPIDFIYAYQERTTISLKIPAGYSVESMPEKVQIALDDNIGSFSYSLQQIGDSIQIVALEQIVLPVISQDYYSHIKEFFGKLANKQNEKIVLKKN
jgi:transglutaminase-like putative cysteine protease